MTPDLFFPNLKQSGFRVTSRPTSVYNCLAWAAQVDDAWWDPAPGYYWPDQVSRDGSIGSLISVYEKLGFRRCDDDALEMGFEKVAVYGNNWEYTHAARQLPSGKWTSKLGKEEDIEHTTPEGLVGAIYGNVVQIMKRGI